MANYLDNTSSTQPLNTPNLIVSIDGVVGAGKTTFAYKMLAQFGGNILSVDDYLTPSHGSYLQWIKFRQMKLDFEKLKHRSKSLIVIEGICILAVLQKIDITPDLKVYLRRIDQSGSWVDSHLCEEFDHLEDKLQWMQQFERHTNVGSYDREIAQYHIQHKPISNADFVINTQI